MPVDTTEKLKGFRSKLMLVASSVAILAAAPIAMAQDEPAAAETNTANDDTRRLAVVTTTAQKREQNTLDVPLSLAVVGGEAIADGLIEDAGDLQALVPGLNFLTTGESKSQVLAIRGVGTDSFSQAIETSVGVTIDGVPMAEAAMGLFPFDDVAQVEVLRGPQGMLFGKSASAGVINITTRRPTEELTGQLRGTFSPEFNDTRLFGGISGRLFGDDTEGALGRVSVFSNTRDGLVENVFDGSKLNNADNYGARAKIDFQLGPTVNFLLSADYGKSDTNCCTSTYRVAGPTTSFLISPVVPGEDNLQTNSDLGWGNAVESYGLSGEANVDIGDFVFTSLTAYREYNEQGFSDDGLPIEVLSVNANDTESTQFSQEFRLTSPDTGPLTYVVGVFGSIDELDTTFMQAIPPGVLAPVGISSNPFTNVETSSIAAFGQMDYDITDKLTGIVGLRLTQDKVTADIMQTLLPGTVPLSAPPFDKKETLKEDHVSWRIGANYRATDNMSFFATVSRGNKGGGFNTTPTPDIVTEDRLQRVEKEVATNYEIGMKSILFDGNLSFNAAAFYTEFDGFQIEAFDSSAGTLGAFILQNAANLETSGIEADFVLAPTDNFTLSGSAAYIDATFAEFPNAPCYIGQSVAEGCVGGVQDLAGADLANSPDLSFNISGRYEIGLPSLPFDGFIRTTYSWQDDVQFSNNQEPQTIQEAYGVLNGAIGITGRDTAYRVELFAQNITDEYFVDTLSRFTILDTFTSQFPSYNAQQIWGITVGYDF